MMQIPLFLIVILILLALVGIYVTRPLFTTNPETEVLPLEDTTALKEAVYQSILERIRELDFDFKLGKLSTQEHEEQRAALVNEAADALRELRSGDDHPHPPEQK